MQMPLYTRDTRGQACEGREGERMGEEGYRQAPRHSGDASQSDTDNSTRSKIIEK